MLFLCFLTFITSTLSLTRFTMTYNNGRQILGYQPDGSGTYPLFVWVTGTQMNYNTNDDTIYIQYMASNRFVSVSLEYPNTLYPLTCADTSTGFVGKAKTMFDQSNPNSALSRLCNPTLPETQKIDCNKGIILAGFSQGAQLVSLSANFGFNNLIRGVYQMGGGYEVQSPITFSFSCLRYENTLLDNRRIRSCAGEWDGYFGRTARGVYTQQQIITNYCTNSNDIIYNCLQNDGSGFYIVRDNEVVTGDAVHCYAYENTDCHMNDGSPQFDVGYYPGNSESRYTWSLDGNMEWLYSRVYNDNGFKHVKLNITNSSRLFKYVYYNNSVY